jgi:hypothetical protein
MSSDRSGLFSNISLDRLITGAPQGACIHTYNLHSCSWVKKPNNSPWDFGFSQMDQNTEIVSLLYLDEEF